MFPIVFVHYSAHYCAQTSSNNGFVSLCQHEKTTVSIYHRFDRSAFTMFKNIVQTIACFITHSDNAIVGELTGNNGEYAVKRYNASCASMP